MRYLRKNEFNEKTIESLTVLSREFVSSDTEIIKDAIRLYFMAHKAKYGEVWNMDDIKSCM